MVTADGVSSGTAVQVATVAPVVTRSTANLAAGAGTLTIDGFGFDGTAAHNSVVLSNGAAGTVTAATATTLTVNVTTKPTAGNLTAVVTTGGVSSGTAVQVATVTPVVTSSTANLAANATSLTINGYGFDTTAGHNTVTFNDGAAGTVTAATATSLTVSLSTKPTALGSLTAVVTTDSQSSGAAVQVATVRRSVTKSTANVAINAASMTISGAGFDTTYANNSVVFNDGVVGSVTGATATTLTVSFSAVHRRQPDRRGHDQRSEQRHGSPGGHRRRDRDRQQRQPGHQRHHDLHRRHRLRCDQQRPQ